MAACRQDQADLLWRSSFSGNRAGYLIGKSLDYERMSWVDVIVMNDELRIRTPSFDDGMPKSLALQQVEIERGGQDENFAASFMRNRGRQVVDGS
jgi:hypothetical protein